MSPHELEHLLHSLISTWENELLEFKEATDNFSIKDIGKYFSALANEANLRGQKKAWLVFGVCDKSKQVVGTNYRCDPERLQSTKKQISDVTQPSVTFRNIHVLDHSLGGRVIMFEIPAAPAGMPIASNGHYFGRANQSLGALSVDKLDEIRNQTRKIDWSAQLVLGATLEDLDPDAVTKARESFARKHANRFEGGEVMGWSDATFLDRARITQGGKITRTALLLLGKAESSYLLSHSAQITWKLKGQEHANEHFSLPFLLATSELYKRIRNIKLRILPDDELLPIEVDKYDQEVVLEALHNCIAHQDYTKNGRVLVTEFPDKLTFENAGGFYLDQPDDYVEEQRTPLFYRNTFLVQAMAELLMIDTMGYGIHKMHTKQAQRHLPLPDYDLSKGNAVKMTLYGGVVDPAYSKLLMQKTDLSLSDILALDRVQKKLPIPDDKIRQLRRAHLIEGRKPNLHVSAYVAAATSGKVDYMKTRSLDDAHYKRLVIDYLKKFGSASRQDISDLLFDKLSDVLSDDQKQRKIGNLLMNMRRSGYIFNAGSRKHPTWKTAEKGESNNK